MCIAGIPPMHRSLWISSRHRGISWCSMQRHAVLSFVPWCKPLWLSLWVYTSSCSLLSTSVAQSPGLLQLIHRQSSPRSSSLVAERDVHEADNLCLTAKTMNPPSHYTRQGFMSCLGIDSWSAPVDVYIHDIPCIWFSASGTALRQSPLAAAVSCLSTCVAQSPGLLQLIRRQYPGRSSSLVVRREMHETENQCLTTKNMNRP